MSDKDKTIGQKTVAWWVGEWVSVKQIYTVEQFASLARKIDEVVAAEVERQRQKS